MLGKRTAERLGKRIGVAAQRRWRGRAETVAQRALDLILWVILPPCVFINIAHFRFSNSELQGLIEGYGVLALVAAGALWAGRRWLALPEVTIGAFICCAIIGNTGYFGQPVTLAVLGRSDLGAATAWDAMITGPCTFVGAFAVGTIFGVDRESRDGQNRWRGFLVRNPVLWAMVAGLLVSRVHAIPEVLAAPAQLALTALLPVGFAALGVFLAGRPSGRLWQRPDRSMCAAIGLRMGFAPALFAVLASFTHGVPAAFYLQAAAPTGLNALITSHVHGLDSDYTAAVVTWSTLLGLTAILVAVLVGVS